MAADALALASTLWTKKVPAWARWAAYAAAVYAAREAVARLTAADLRGQVVLITGGGSGLGRGLALKLAAEHGCRIIVWDRDATAAAATAAAVTAAGGAALAYAVDVTKKEEVAAQAAACVADMGAEVDILINNAGVVHGRSVLDAPEGAIEATFNVNVVSHCWMLRAFLPAMLRRNSGTVVTLASASGLVGVAKLEDYAASKWAAFGLGESLRMELKRRGSAVRTLIVAPYYINTGMFDGVHTRFPLLLPILEPDYVINSIVTSLRRGDELLVMPRAVAILPFLRAFLPTPVFDATMFALGINGSMENFRGRAGESSSGGGGGGGGGGGAAAAPPAMGPPASAASPGAPAV